MSSQTSCKEFIKHYCSNCTFAGIRFIADDTKHWIERLLWVVLVVLSWYGSALLIISSWESFVSSPINFGVETTYKDWNTKMPTVAVCEISNDDSIYNVSDTIWPPEHLVDLEDALRDIAYFRGLCYTLYDICYATSKPDPLCPTSNFSYYAQLVRSTCPQILQNCSYNDQDFDCCKYFQPIATDMGTCFIINSIQTEDPKPYPMISNQQNKRGVIKFEVKIPSTMYTLAEDEVPSITTSLASTMKILPGRKYRRQVALRNIENDPLVAETSPEQRACKFYYENKEGLYPKYSYSACTVLCRKRAQLGTCHCYDHFMLGATEEDRCNITGLACIHLHASHLTTLKPSWALRPGLYCDCLPSCDDTEITVIKDVDTKVKANKNKATVEVVMAVLPTERFKRNVVRSRLDLVVSIGGTTGLFVGASLLSFVELIFFFSVRYVNNHWIESHRKVSLQKAVSQLEERILFDTKMKRDLLILKRKKHYEESGIIKINPGDS